MTSLRMTNPDGAPAPVGQYTNVALVAPAATVAHVAGQLPVDAQGQVLAPGDFDRQADAVFDSLAATLEGLGSSLAQVAFIRAFMVEDEAWVPFREARARAYAKHGVAEPPPATTLVVKSLYGGALIELDAVAVVPSDPSS